jgi:SAM-dependent methyltransferase
VTQKLVNVLRAGRHVALLALSPLDYLSRQLNCKTHLPPLHLRRYVGPLESFESSGAEFMGYLRSLAGLRPNERVLDIGCGCGQMALQLEHHLDENGSYVGVDIHGPSIRWCQKNIGRRRGNFQFARIDVRNLAYNPHGKHRAETYQFPFDEQSFDLILLKSVFTHMRPPEVSNYLREVARLLKSNGRCLATFFLLNEEQARLAEEGANDLTFQHGEGVWRYRLEQSPESAVAFDERYVLELVAQYGLALKAPIYYGRWAGRQDGLSYQDILLLEKNYDVERDASDKAS